MSDVLTPTDFASISGWHAQHPGRALQAFQRSAAEILQSGSGFRRQAAFGGTREDWQPACLAAAEALNARQFFETWFRPFRVTDTERPEGLLTGYYEPLVTGSMEPGPAFPVPVYAKPSDLVAFSPEEITTTGLSYGRRINEQALPYDTREAIERGSLANKTEVLCWLSDWVDAFFMHIQGQGRVQLSNGKVIRLSYAGKTGHPYTGIGHVLVQQGHIAKPNMSMQTLRQWMRDNPHEARQLMWQNKSYIFFQAAEISDDTLGGIGAAKVNLTPLHSLAVDRAWWMFGTPLWVETSLPPEVHDPSPAIQRLMIAQDTGSAIKGIVRGDFFWGWGDDAVAIAGHMKSPGSMVALLPLPLACKLGHKA